MNVSDKLGAVAAQIAFIASHDDANEDEVRAALATVEGIAREAAKTLTADREARGAFAAKRREDYNNVVADERRKRAKAAREQAEADARSTLESLVAESAAATAEGN